MIELSCHHELFGVEGFDQRHLSGVSWIKPLMSGKPALPPEAWLLILKLI